MHLGQQIVQRAHLIAVSEQFVGQMGADESAASGNQHAFGHGISPEKAFYNPASFFELPIVEQEHHLVLQPCILKHHCTLRFSHFSAK